MKKNKKTLIAIIASVLCVAMLLPIFLNGNNSTDNDSTNVKEYPALEEIAKQEDKYDTKELLENVQKLNEEQMTELTRKTLLVCATDFDTSNTGAINIEQNDIVYSLTYNSTKEACEAYKEYSHAENILYCEFDTVLKTQDVEIETTPTGEELHVLDFSLTSKEAQELGTKDYVNILKQEQESYDTIAIFDTLKSMYTYDYLKEKDNYVYENILKTQSTFDILPYNGIKIVVIDSGATGYTNGYNAFDGSNDVTDTIGHGTKMISIIKDILKDADYADKIEIIPIKVANENGVGSITAVLNALAYTTTLDDVLLVNMSLASNDLSVSELMENYITKLQFNGTAVVASAGNNNDDTQYYVPAKFDTAIVVGSCDENGKRKGFSNYGNSVDHYVVSDSTSEAAAITTAYYAKSFMNNDINLIHDIGLFFDNNETIVSKADAEHIGYNEFWFCVSGAPAGHGGTFQGSGFGCGGTCSGSHYVKISVGQTSSSSNSDYSNVGFSIQINDNDDANHAAKPAQAAECEAKVKNGAKYCIHTDGCFHNGRPHGYLYLGGKRQGGFGWISASTIQPTNPHTHTQVKWTCNAAHTQHKLANSCEHTVLINWQNHSFGNWIQKNSTHHKKVCGTSYSGYGSCGCEKTEPHNFDWTYSSDRKTRYWKCQTSTCGYISYTQYLLTVTYDSHCEYSSGHSNGAWITSGTSYSTTAKTKTLGYGLDDRICGSSCFTSDTQTVSGTMTGPKPVSFTSGPITYKIHYQLYYGTNNSANPPTYNVTSNTIVFQDPSKVGAKFLGWSLKSIAGGSTGCKTTTASWESYVFTLTTDANGGYFSNGQTTKVYSMPYYTHPNDPTAAYYTLSKPTKNGYEFMGWNLTSTWKNNNVNEVVDISKDANKTANEYSHIITGTGIETKNNSGIIYAQWEKVITYSFNYYNNGGTTQNVIVKYHNDDKEATITKFTNNGQYGTPGDGVTIRNVNEGSITLTGITSNKSIKFGGNAGVYNWNFNGLAKENQSAIAPRYEETDVNTSYITVYAKDVADKVGTVKFYASYYRQPEITFIDYGNNTQVTRKVNGSANNSYITNNLTAGINNKQTVQNTTTVYARYDGTVQQEVVVTLMPQTAMSLRENNGKNVPVNESWNIAGWTTGSTLYYQKAVTNIGKTFERTNVYNLSGIAGTFDDQQQNTKISTYQDLTYYGLYTKKVVLTTDANGGLIPLNNGKMGATRTYESTRNVNAYNINASSKPIQTLAHPVYENNTGTKFEFKLWTYDRLALNDPNFESHRLRNKFSCTDNCKRLHDGQIVHSDICNSFNDSIHELRNNGTATYEYTPLVTETVYASWTNDTIFTQAYEPKVTISKAAEWYNASKSDTGIYDFDALGNINLDGIVKVTITVNINNPSGVNTKDMYVTDYFNTNIWDLYDLGGLSSRNGDKLTWNIPNGVKGTQTCTYYLKLKEAYWTKDASGDCKYINNEIGSIASDSNGSAYSNMVNGKLYYNYYTNRIPDINKYLNSLNADGTINTIDSYFYSDAEARKSYVWIDFKVNGGFNNNAERQIHNKSADVKMRQVSFIPTVSNGVNIETDENNTKDYLNGMHTNIYHDYSSAYNNTYFVKYNTKGDYDSTFKISMASQLTKSYSYYQISDNLFDVVATTTKKEQVIDNQIAVSATKNNTSVLFKENIADTTDASKKVNADMLANKHLRSGFGSQLLLDVDAQLTLHSSVNTNGVIYNNAAASTKTTLHATNQDNLYISIYPFVKTTNTKTGISYSISDRIDRNKRLDLVIDATDPVITADGELISADGSNTSTWNAYKQYCKDNNVKSDGYIDINLINTSTNKKNSVEEYEYLPGTINPYSYEFKFYDAVSGISNPNVNTSDWIKRPHDNIIVTLTRIDDGKVLFDSANDPYYNKNNKYVSLTYASSSPSSINKNASLKVQFYANDPDNLGHIQLKIRVYDNVYNYTDKVYDFYTFALTANVSIVSPILENDPLRLNNISHFYNGEQGKINISANGFVDRVTVTHESDFNTAFLKDYTLLKVKLGNDAPKTANSDYPHNDYISSAYVPAHDRFSASKLYAKEDGKYILPVGAQQVYWGYQDGKYGGLVMSNATTSLLPYITINTRTLPIQDLLPDMISRYLDFKNGEVLPFVEGVHGDYTYAFSGNIFYINPVIVNNTIKSAEYYISISSSDTLYGFENLPVALTIDGCTSIPVTYEIEIPEDMTVEEMFAEMTVEEMLDTIVNSATVPETVKYKFSMESEWVSDGSSSYRKPLVHYFYVPLQLKTHADDVPNYTTLTAYQDSETGWAHKVTIRVSFTNEDKPILENLDTIISDN